MEYNYLELLKTIKEYGVKKPPARMGQEGTLSFFGYSMSHNLQHGFPLLTTKKIPFRWIVEELLWFLRGDTNIHYLVKKGIDIWNGDAYNYYNKMLSKYNIQGDGYTREQFDHAINEQGPVAILGLPETIYRLGDCGYQYGRVWRKWEKIDPATGKTEIIDQIDRLIRGLKNNPESRRHILTAVDPAHDEELALYWCHCLAQFNCRPIPQNELYLYTPSEDIVGVTPRYYLDCQLYQRSADVFLGVPFNIASYALLTHLLARVCYMVPGRFNHVFGDVHIYDNHIAQVDEQLTRQPMALPNVYVLPNLSLPHNHPDHGMLPDHLKKYMMGIYSTSEFMEQLTHRDFGLEGYKHHPALHAELSTGTI